MREFNSCAGPLSLVLGAVVGLATWVGGAQAVDPQKTLLPNDQKPAAQAEEKTVTFEMRGKPWGTVLEWLTDQSGIPFITELMPQGTFNFIAPKSAGGRYTIPQVIDILNEALLQQKLILIRRDQSFTIVAADQKIDPAILPRILPEELKKHGNTELVSVVVPLKSLVAEDFVDEVNKLKGPFGEVVALKASNKLVIQDTVGNIRRIIQTIHDVEDTEKNQGESFSHVCQYIKARDAEAILNKLLGDPQKLLDAMRPAPGGGFGGFGGRGGFGGFGGGNLGGGFGPMPAQPPAQQQPAANAPKIRMHYITSDERTNSVLVTGPADKIALARDIMKKIDVPQKDQPRKLIGPKELKKYDVPAGNAEALAKTLQTIYPETSGLRISAVGQNAILVYAGPDDQFDIAQHIISSKGETGPPVVIALNALEASDAVATLKGMFGEDTKAGAPFLKADTTRNEVIVKGTTDQVSDVKLALKALGEGGGGAMAAANMRIITLDKGSAAALAETLQRILSEMRDNPVRVITPGSDDGKKQGADTPRSPSDIPRPPAKSPGNGVRSSAGAREDIRVAYQPLVDPQQQPQPAQKAKPGNKKQPINIAAFGNKLIITSDDPEALAMAQALVRVLTQTPDGKGDFEVIRLKNASAVDAAKILDEVFNGRQQTPQQGFPGFGGPGAFFNQFRAPGAGLPTNPVENRIRVVADPGSNSLLVRASPLDMMSIRRLLEKAIDSGATDSSAVLKTWPPISLKYANAPEVAGVIRDVYREQINNNPLDVRGLRGGFGAIAAASINRNVDANGNPRGVSLSVAVDERSNKLVVMCSEAMYKDVSKLAKQLDDAAQSTTRTVRFIPVKGIDPVLVQQAIDAIQGRRTVPRTGNGQGYGNGAGGGFGGDGFSPGMIPRQGGGGGGGGGRGGGGQRGTGSPPGNQQGRGPDFFDYRVTDDPQASVLYDPQQSINGAQQSSGEECASGLNPEARDALQLAAYEELQQPGAGPVVGPPAPGDTQAPRHPVTADALPELGGIVISGDPADVEAIVRLIEFLQQRGAGAEVQIQLVPLKHADATSVSSTLTQLYQRVIVNPAGNVRSTAPTQTTTTQGQFGAQTTATQQPASVILLPLARLNAILLAAPKARLDEIVQQIMRLDRPSVPQGRAVPFPLRKASAARVATLITSFYAQRYPNESAAQHQIRVTEDPSTNTVFVQAAPADLDEIRELIDRLDTTVSSAVHDVRIVYLRNTLAEELATLLLQAISQGVTAPTPAAPSAVPAGGVPVGGVRPAGAVLPGAAQPGVAQPGAVPGAVPAAAPGAAAPAGAKSTTLRFISPRPGLKGVPESGLLEDIRITPDIRVNALILSAPAKTIDLLLALIRDLDVPPPLRAEIKVFTLRKADAQVMAGTLQQLFFGTAGGAGAGGLPGGGGLPGAGTGGLPGAPGGALGGAMTAGAVGVTALPRAAFSLGVPGAEGAPIIPLSITVDQRTNSIIVAGGRNELDVIDAIIFRLEDADVQPRINNVYHLRNSSAADVATALQNFLNNSLNVFSKAGQLTTFQELQRDVIIVPEPISNKLLVSATPRYYGDVMQLIEELDVQPPQVMIQVLVAEVDLTNTEEFGVEIGLQSPVLFSRSVIPAPSAFGSGTVSFANATGGLVAPGVSVSGTLNPAAQPGFLFNTTNPLGNNPAAGQNGVVGFQGLNNLGVGRASPTSSIGGFVFSAASDTFSLLIRALRTQGRLDVLSRPQIMTLDSQTAIVNIGQNIPIVSSSTVTATGLVTSNIERLNVGVNLQVTPRINPDGTVLMRVIPEVSSVLSTTVPLGNGTFGTSINLQHVETTVLAGDGETVAIGGLISKRDNKIENKIPWFGDLPLVGAAFRFRTQDKTKTELLVILTPHVVRSRLDADQVLAAESRRIDWVLGDVLKVHGTTGLAPILPPVPAGPGAAVPGGMPFWQGCPGQPDLAAPPGAPAPPGIEPVEPLPQPRPLPGSGSQGKTSDAPAAAMPAATGGAGAPMGIPVQTDLSPSSTGQPADGGPALPAEPTKEKRGWSLFRRNK